MSYPRILGQRTYGNTLSAAPAVFILDQAQATQLGTNFGTIELEVGATTGSTSKCINNRVVRFKGATYTYQYNSIYKYNAGTTSWTLVFSSSHYAADQVGPVAVGQSAATGLFVQYIGSTPQMMMAYANTDSNTTGAYLVYTSDGAAFTENYITPTNFNSATTNKFPNSMFRPIQYNGNIYFDFPASAGNSNSWTWDPTNKSISQVTLPTSHVPVNIADTCIYNSNLYRIQRQGIASNLPVTIYRLVGGAWTSECNLATSTNSRVDTHGAAGWSDTYGTSGSGMCMHALFTPCDSFMYALHYFYNNDGSSMGWRMHQLTITSSVITEVVECTSLLPTAYQYPNFDSRVGGTYWRGGWNIFQDESQSPGSTPATYLFFARDPTSGSPWSMYKWVNSTTALAFVDSGAPVEISLPHQKVGSGERLQPALNLYVDTPSRPTPGTSKITYSAILYTVPSGTTSNTVFRLWYSADGTAQLKSCSLLNPSSGSLAVDHKSVTGLTADGTTTYTFDWDMATDGVVDGTLVTLVPEVSLT